MSYFYHFYTPWKHQKTFGFLLFSGGIDRNVSDSYIRRHAAIPKVDV